MSNSIRVLVALLALVWTAPALALDSDPTLHRFVDLDSNGNIGTVRQDLFREYARELGMAMAPKLLSPAETLGLNGFATGFEFSLTNIDNGAEHWTRGVQDGAAPGTLKTTQLHIRKGLPYSVEVGATATYLLETEMFAFGVEGKIAFNEAVDDFPVDIAARGFVQRVVGSPELNMTNFGGDLIISRSFGVGGVANVAPYMAYNPLVVVASSDVLDATPGCGPSRGGLDDDCPAGGDPQRNFVLAEETEVLHRFVLGTRFIFSLVNFTPEVVIAQGLQTYNFKLGLDY